MPFVDSGRAEISLFSLLVYLTAGECPSGALYFEDRALTRIDQDLFVIFDIRKRHGGRPFEASSKLFLRTDLIFRQPPSFSFSQTMAHSFNQACYFALYSSVYKQQYRSEEIQRLMAE